MNKTGIVLAGGFSSRFGQDKGLLNLANKPLVKHVLNSISDIVDERLVIVSSKTQRDRYSKAINGSTKILVDTVDIRGPVAGALTGLQEARGDYSFLLACDVPFVSKDILLLLFELCINRNAAIPRWSNCYIEPLQAVYRTKPTLEAVQKALSQGNLTMQAVVDKLKCVRYVSTLVLEQLDPDLKTFFNINTPVDLKKAQHMLEHTEKRLR